MDSHQNARTTPKSRALIAARVAGGATVAAVARGVGVCDRTVRKWVERAAEGDLALEDRSCRPHDSPRSISMAVVVEIERLRRRYRWTARQIAEIVQVSRATVARTLSQLGLARLAALTPAAPGRRYEWARPGQLVHADIKKLGRIGQIGHRITGDRRHRARGIGWEFVHVCIDDHSRVAYVEVLPDERGVTIAGFIRRAMAWFARRGVHVERILTDNGSGYRSQLVAALCRARALGQRFTRPYTPRTNGKAERFIQTLLREWAYAVAYPTSTVRTAALMRWLHYYNWHRPHTALANQPPISRLVSQDDLLRLHS
jgi:transposase InsO family protein